MPDRDANGHFAKGNKLQVLAACERHARTIEDFRRLFFETVREKNVFMDIVEELIKCAKQDEDKKLKKDCIFYFLDRCLGKPDQFVAMAVNHPQPEQENIIEAIDRLKKALPPPQEIYAG